MTSPASTMVTLTSRSIHIASKKLQTVSPILSRHFLSFCFLMVPVTKSRKFPEITGIHDFYSILFLKK